MIPPRYPSLFQINTRVWLTDLSRSLKRPATLDDVPDAALDRLAKIGFDWIWLLSVWQTGLAGQRVSRTNREWRHEFYESLGHELKVVSITGGGTDAAYAALSGKPVIEALGLPGFGYRANVREWVVIDAIARRLYLSAQMITWT
jgi:hypothetical protein